MNLLRTAVFAFAAMLGIVGVSAQDKQAVLHYVDVNHGQAVLLDVGDFEVLIDGGQKRSPRETDSHNHLGDYINNIKFIDGPLDLLIISDSHISSIQNTQEIFFPSTKQENTIPVAEVWASGPIDKWPGSTCKVSPAFQKLLDRMAAGGKTAIRAPASLSFRPALDSGELQEIRLPGSADVAFLVINSGLPEDEMRRLSVPGRCPPAINNGSLVVGIEVYGVRILFSGDIESGYRENEPYDAGLNRQDILVEALRDMAWLQSIDILIAPRWGSRLSNSPEFVELTSPQYTLMGAAPVFNLPNRAVFDRYFEAGSSVLSTARTKKGGLDNIVCSWSAVVDLKCVYGSWNAGDGAVWEGKLANGEKVKQLDISRIAGETAEKRKLTEVSAFGSGSGDLDQRLVSADLFGIDLTDVDLSFFDLSKADLRNSVLVRTDLSDGKFDGTRFDHADISGADFSNSKMNGLEVDGLRANGVVLRETEIVNSSFANATFAGAQFVRTFLNAVRLRSVTLDDVVFEPANFSLSGSSPSLGRIDDIDAVPNLETLRFETSPTALMKIRNYFADSRQYAKRASITYAIETSKKYSTPVSALRLILFKIPTEYGLAPNRPILIIILLIPIFSLAYVIAILRSGGSGLYAVQAQGTGPSVAKIATPTRIHHRTWRAAVAALYFSLLSTFHLGWRDINVGMWIQRLSPVQFGVEATGWIRVVAGLQSLICFYLLVMWGLMFFGDPFG